MTAHVTIREWGCLGQADAPTGLDYAQINQFAWDWLKALCLSQTEGEKKFLALVSRHGQECLQVRNFVGVLESPSGLQIEILPKISEYKSQSISNSRDLLWKMLCAVNDISWIETEEAHLRTKDRPIIEVLIQKFLAEVNTLVKRGIRNDYVRVAEKKNFLRGRLNVSKQLRQSPTQQHRFNIEYDKYISDRSENRLLKLALVKALRCSNSSMNQRLARELLYLFDAIPASENIRADFAQWRSSREMVYYQSSKPWCQLIINEQSPFFSSGGWQGVSLLYPMEQLFEKYVGKKLSAQVDRRFRLSPGIRGQHLVRHSGQNWFTLIPDYVIREKGKREPKYVLDAKWKLIDSSLSNGTDKYKIKPADIYQLFAYGQKYLKGTGEIYLIYPSHAQFDVPLPPFDFSDDLRLWVVPFDLESDSLNLHNDCLLPDVFKESKYLMSA